MTKNQASKIAIISKKHQVGNAVVSKYLLIRQASRALRNPLNIVARSAQPFDHHRMDIFVREKSQFYAALFWAIAGSSVSIS